MAVQKKIILYELFKKKYAPYPYYLPNTFNINKLS